MSTLVKLPLPAFDPENVAISMPDPGLPTAGTEASWSPRRFAEEQIRMLVRQVFFPGRSKSARHVVFSAVEESTYVAEICMDTARTLSSQVSGSICVIEANPHNPELESVFARKKAGAFGRDGFVSLKNSAQHIASNLWLAPLNVLLAESVDGVSSIALERRLAEFRADFDYTVLHAAPAGRYSEAALLGQLCDGVVLVVEANSTRRVAAQKAKETLQAANTRVLGIVLSERTFPIPERIYRRL